MTASGERGSAIVEFLGVALLLLVPLVYLVLTLAAIQAATFAAEGAAREAGRIVAQAESLEEAGPRARLATELAFADHGITVDGRDALRLTCEEDPCHTPGARVHVEVAASVRLPLIPDVLGAAVPLEVPVVAEHLAVVPEFGGAP
ncbi:pilus assembly protein [Georgenia faecalis]|uniref:pilus assembly protein n=1 Tax=Georgenia faecalis TaxID=2483799 RepID=UPI001F493C2A|nr:pilus assembly protein [Georgenia faecalis]